MTERNRQGDDAAGDARGERGDRDLRRSEPGADGGQQFHVAGAHAAQANIGKKRRAPRKQPAMLQPAALQPPVRR